MTALTPPYPNDQHVPLSAIPVRLALADGSAFYNAGSGAPAAPYVATPLGYQQITSLSGAQTLTVPAGATFALIQAEAVDVRWRDDGIAPTASVGMLLPSGQPTQFSGDLSVLKFIQTSGGSATLNVSYYK